MEETRLDKHGLELVWGKIKAAVQGLRTKVGTADLTTTSKDLSGAVNELKNEITDIKYPTPTSNIVYQSTNGAVRSIIVNNMLVISGRDVNITFNTREIVLGTVVLPTGYTNTGVDIGGSWSSSAGNTGTIWFNTQNQLRIFSQSTSTIQYINFALSIPLKRTNA